MKICLDALSASIYRNLEIILVDPTLWWDGATKLGIRSATDRCANSIMLLNNDCYITPETIGRLVELSGRAGEVDIGPIQKDFFIKRVLCVKASTCFCLDSRHSSPPKKQLKI